MSCSPALPKKAQVVEVKQGDTLMLGCQALDADDEPVSLIDVTVTAQGRKVLAVGEEEVVFEFEVEMVDEAIGTYELWYPDGGIFVGPIGDYIVDVQYSAPVGSRTVVRSSRDFYVRVLPGVTA